MTKYLVRLDDACPTMDHAKWQRIENILAKYNVKPMVGIIPNNKYDKLSIDEPNPNFWDLCKKWQDDNWAIALHGYDHVYITKEGGLHPVNFKSEFAGVPLEVQKEKISKGYKILKSNGINPEYFFAPAHTFDDNTIKAIEEETQIRKISDTIALKPYQYNGMVFIPQQVGQFRNIKLPGYWTFCFHPNTMKEKDFTAFDDFINKHKDSFTSFDEVKDINSSKKLVDKILHKLYFLTRKIR